ncbi:predicted protein [Histoplasma capsulatum H143]|uniref:Uncharacterized protein n=1 Tax=Ajellomyces capsulatus (strain H143) TaxID=544712 RepID=C6HSQ6_AJECH|nr:predicted protein [Histoplasma capsulatum H143]
MAQATYFGIFSEATLTRRQIMLNVLYFTPYGYPLEGPKPLTSDTLRSSNRNVEKYPMMSRTQVGQFCAKGGNDNDDGVATGHVPDKCRARSGLQSPTMNSIRSDQNLSQPLSLQDSNVTPLNYLNALGPAIQYRKYLLAFFSLPVRRSKRSHLVPLSVIDEKCRRSFIFCLCQLCDS